MIIIDFKKLGKVQELLEDAVLTDGDHHKQWFLEQIAKELDIELPVHDDGVAP